MVAEAMEEKSDFSVLYPDEMSIEENQNVATKVYGVDEVDFHLLLPNN